MRFTFLIVLFYVIATGHVSGQQDSTISQEPWQPAQPVEKMPSFPGGTGEMYKFIYSEMRYPPEAKRLKVSGQVITEFLVNADGSIQDIVVKRGPGYGLDEEAIRVITVMQEKIKWIPGMHNGKPIAVKFTLPLKFVLQ